ncbi:MAG: hypothetical protein JSC189_000046 [Candidatus Tokpelaia sp. JSC189]|nr:MAG: hypothetical protein JSC189_000046 [Candidatus Tokpelaia sp. JSC189]
MEDEIQSIMSIANFTMPTPPSTNALFSNRKSIGRIRTTKYKDFIMMGLASIRNQNVKPVKGNVLMLIGVECMSEWADIDNPPESISGCNCYRRNY